MEATKTLKTGQAFKLVTKPFVDSDSMDFEPNAELIGQDRLHLYIKRNGSGRFAVPMHTVVWAEAR